MTKKEPTSNQDNQTDEKRLSADTKKDTSKKSAETTSQEDAPYQKSEEISHVEELLDKITENATLQDLIEQIDKHLEAEEALLTILKREQELLENFNNAIADRDKYLSMLQRFKADFENYKKRAKKQNENKVQFHSQRIVSKIFEPIEELNKAITYAKETEQETIPLEGLNIIYNKLVRNLKDEGFAFIEPSKGDVFDPREHDAICTAPPSNEPADRIVKTFQKGFKLNNRVIQAAKVMVSVEPPKEKSKSKAGEENEQKVEEKTEKNNQK